MSRRIVLTEKQRKKMVELYTQHNLSAIRIAKRFQVQEARIREILVQEGVRVDSHNARRD